MIFVLVEHGVTTYILGSPKLNPSILTVAAVPPLIFFLAKEMIKNDY